MQDEGAERAFLDVEYAQAWEHYRHTETQRLQYLGFFFTVALGSVALAVPLIADSGLASSAKILVAGLFAMTFQTTTYFIFVSVHRFGAVLDFYLAAMTALRAERAALTAVDSASALRLDVRGGALPKPPGGFGIQRTAELILIGASGAAALCGLGSTIAAATAPRSVMGGAALVMGILCT